MRLILIGSEYAGKTTLVEKIVEWRNATMGQPTPRGIVQFHDHFTLPWVGHWDEISEEDMDKFMSLGPELKEMFQRYQFSYHLSPWAYRDSDHILVGFHIEDAVYAPLYYGYGKKGEYGDREAFARHFEAEIIEMAADTVLVLLTASADVIAERMRSAPHARTVLKEKDIDFVLERFDYHFKHSLLRYKFTLDTSNATVEETLQEFIEAIEPNLSQADRMRIQTHRTLGSGG
jgi:GTPase SAR1 family protein